MRSATPRPIEVLLIEDNVGDARLIEAMMAEVAPRQFRFTWVNTLAAALREIGGTHHVALLDLALPDSQGLNTLAKLRAAAPALPIVVLSGTDDDALALQAVHQGAQDYLVKGQGGAEVLRRAVRYAIERAATERNMRRSEGQFRAIFENAGLGIGLIDGTGTLVSTNPALQMMLEGDAARSIDKSLYSYVHTDDRDQFIELTASLLVGRREEFSAECRFVPQNGHFGWGRVHVSLVRGGDGQPQFAVGLVEDVTGRKAMEDQLRLAAKVLEATSEGVFVTDTNLNIVHVNPSFTQLTGYEAADVLGRRPSVLASGRHGPDFYATMWKSIKEEGYWRGEIWDRKKSGELFAMWTNISAVKNESGGVSNYVAVFSDITLRKLSEERLSHMANHDALTGLPNRALFREHLERALARAQRNKLVFAVLFVDLDQFKQINDQLGHLTGDSLLQEVAERLTSSVRHQDTVARLGGDEFTVIIEDINDFRDAATVAQKILARFAVPFHLNGVPTTVTASIGISLYPLDGTELTCLLQHADEAMYCAKKQGHGLFRFASADVSEKAFERESMKAALRTAVDEGELELHYQPVVDLVEGRVTTIEALLRWHHPQIGLMVPGQFLPLAIETGLMPALGRWVLRTSIAQLAQWRAGGHDDLRLGVNVSAVELLDPDFPLLVQAALDEFELPATALDVEVPESVVMAESPVTLRVIEELHGMGCRVALDDFGAGRTDFRVLRHVPVDLLKISADFTRGVPENAEEAKLVHAAIVVAHSMQISVVAKGVEANKQLAFLRQHHCDAGQGYLFSGPVPVGQFPPTIDLSALAAQ